MHDIVSLFSFFSFLTDAIWTTVLSMFLEHSLTAASSTAVATQIYKSPVYHDILYLRVELWRFPSCNSHCFWGTQRMHHADVLADPAIAEAAEGLRSLFVCVSLTGCHYCCGQTIRYTVCSSDGSGDWPPRLQAPRCPAGLMTQCH